MNPPEYTDVEERLNRARRNLFQEATRYYKREDKMNKEWIPILEQCIEKWEDIRDSRINISEIFSFCAACYHTNLHCDPCLIKQHG